MTKPGPDIKLITNLLMAGLVIILALFYNPYVTNWNAKPEVYYYFLGSASLAVFVSLTDMRRALLNLDKIDVVLLLIFACLLCYELASNSFVSLYFSDFFVSLTAVFLIYPALKKLAKRGGDILPFVITAAFLIEILWGGWQLAVMGYRKAYDPLLLTGSLENSGSYAIYLACCLPAAHYALRRFRSPLYARWISAGLIFIVFILVVFCRSRAGTVLFLLNMFFLHQQTIKQFWDKFFGRRQGAGIFAIAMLFLAIALLAYLKYPSTLGRLFIWKICLVMLSEKPFWGWGIFGLEQNYLLNQANYFRTHQTGIEGYKAVAGEVINGVNEYVMVAVEFGLFGLTILLTLLYKGYGIFVKNNKGSGWAPQTLVIIFTGALFYYDLHVTMILITGMIAVAALSAPIIIRIHLRWLASVIRIWISGVVMIYFILTSLQFKATADWAKVSAGDKAGSTDLKLFSKAYPALRHRSNFLYNYGTSLFSAGDYHNAVLILAECRHLHPSVDVMLYLGKSYEMTGDNKKAEACYLEAAFMVPSRFYPRYLLAELYIKMGLTKRAAVLAETVLKMPVKVPSADVNEIKNEMNRILNKYPTH